MIVSLKKPLVRVLLSTLFVSLFILPKVEAATFKKSSITVVDQKGKVERKIFSEISRGSADAPIVVLLNGLIYEMERWSPVAETLADHGMTVVRLSFSPQPESLRLLKKGDKPQFLERGLELPILADDVRQVLALYRIKRPTTLVGLSYGATVATEFAKTFPKLVKNLVLLSPLVVPLDNYQAESAPLRAMLETVRFWENAPCAAYGLINPWLCTGTEFWYDSFYNYFYEKYLNQRVSKIPTGIEPGLYKKAVFQLVRAVRNYDLKTEVALLKNVHLVVASGDDVNLKKDQLKAWSMTPQNARRSFAEFKGVKHALPDEAPQATAQWLEAIASGDASLQSGDEWIVDAK